MKRMDAGGYAACFDHQQLALLCANSDRTIDRLGVENNKLKAENAKLRETLKGLMMGTNTELCADRDEDDCKMCSMHQGEDGCTVVDAMELLGIDMYGEPLRIEVMQ